MLEQADVAQSVRFFKRNSRMKAHLYSQDTTGRNEVSVPVHGAQARSKIACDTATAPRQVFNSTKRKRQRFSAQRAAGMD
jgi:hypothetical protein